MRAIVDVLFIVSRYRPSVVSSTSPSLSLPEMQGAALFFNTMTAPMVKLTQNENGGYDYNKSCKSRCQEND